MLGLFRIENCSASAGGKSTERLVLPGIDDRTHAVAIKKLSRREFKKALEFIRTPLCLEMHRWFPVQIHTDQETRYVEVNINSAIKRLGISKKTFFILNNAQLRLLLLKNFIDKFSTEQLQVLLLKSIDNKNLEELELILEKGVPFVLKSEQVPQYIGWISFFEPHLKSRFYRYLQVVWEEKIQAGEYQEADFYWPGVNQDHDFVEQKIWQFIKEENIGALKNINSQKSFENKIIMWILIAGNEKVFFEFLEAHKGMGVTNYDDLMTYIVPHVEKIENLRPLELILSNFEITPLLKYFAMYMDGPVHHFQNVVNAISSTVFKEEFRKYFESINIKTHSDNRIALFLRVMSCFLVRDPSLIDFTYPDGSTILDHVVHPSLQAWLVENGAKSSDYYLPMFQEKAPYEDYNKKQKIHFLDLPDDVLLLILNRLKSHDRIAVRSISKKLHCIITEEIYHKVSGVNFKAIKDRPVTYRDVNLYAYVKSVTFYQNVTIENRIIALRTHPFIESVLFEEPILNDLIELRNCPHLKKIALNKAFPMDQMAAAEKEINVLLKMHPNLKSLLLPHQTLDLQRLKERCPRIESLALKTVNLEELGNLFPDIVEIEITDLGNDEVDNLIRFCAQRTKLRSLSLTDISEMTEGDFCRLLQQVPHLEVLKITGFKTTQKTLENIALLCPKLKVLSLPFPEGVPDFRPFVKIECLESITITESQECNDSTLLSLKGCTSLQELNLNGTFTDLAVIEFSKFCKGIRELNLMGMKISDHALQTLVFNCRHLVYLNLLDSVEIARNGLEVLLKYAKDLNELILPSSLSVEGYRVLMQYGTHVQNLTVSQQLPEKIKKHIQSKLNYTIITFMR